MEPERFAECICGQWHPILHEMAGIPVMRCPLSPDGDIFIIDPNRVFYARPPVG